MCCLQPAAFSGIIQEKRVKRQIRARSDSSSTPEEGAHQAVCVVVCSPSGSGLFDLQRRRYPAGKCGEVSGHDAAAPAFKQCTKQRATHDSLPLPDVLVHSARNGFGLVVGEGWRGSACQRVSRMKI